MTTAQHILYILLNQMKSLCEINLKFKSAFTENLPITLAFRILIMNF